MEANSTNNMIYRYLGKTGLKVSVLSFGNWVNEKTDEQFVEYAFSKGINYFDTAEIYGFGVAEKYLGNALKKLAVPRKDYVVSTKIFKVGHGVNDAFLSRKHIVEGLSNSLARLQLDYVDIVFCHRFDPDTDLEDICRSMNYVIDKGMAFYWGTSEWEACQIAEAYGICDRLGLQKPTVEQCQYNFFVREKMEKEFVYLFNKHKMATTIWSPLYSGIISGKYLNNSIPEDSRIGLYGDSSAKIVKTKYMSKKNEIDAKVSKLIKLAEEVGVTISQLAIAWVIKNPDTTTCILGASKLAQLKENIDAIDIIDKITEEVEVKIEEIMQNVPELGINWREFSTLTNRRQSFYTKKN